ncbi:MAG TPA: phospholipid carrier-dependent glycosyltransferase [Pyrinomonadaceae bacterium]
MDQPLIRESDATTLLVFKPRRFLSLSLAFVRSHAAEFTSGALLALMGLQMFAVIWRKSITVDELVMIPSAYYHLVDGDFQLVNEHPPLSKLVAAAPLLFVQPNEQAEHAAFWDYNEKKYPSIAFWSRAGMIVLTLTLGVLIFIFARSLFGSRAAVIAVALFSLEPTMLAHGRVVQTDVPAAFGYLLFFMALYWYSSATTWRRAVFLGAAAGVALLAKFSMLLIGLVLPPAFIILWWLSSRRRAVALHAAVVLLAMLFVVNAAYFFQHAPLNDVDHSWIAAKFPAHPERVDQATEVLSHIVPKEFVLGTLFQLVHNREGHNASLLGMYGRMGWWYYFPVAFALKTTLPFLLLSVLAMGWAIFRVAKHRDLRFVWLLAPTLIYSVFVLFSHINIGVRYLAPIFPFLMIAGAALLEYLLQLRRVAATVFVAVLLAWTGVEAVRAFPNHVSYMNQLASGAPHWWYLSDSNVEWGDDVRGLALYLQQHGERRVADATLGGFGILRFYGIERVDPLAQQTTNVDGPKYLAIGASFLNGSAVPEGPPGSGRDTMESRVNYFAAYRQQTPEAVIGVSIYVFRLR